MSLGPCKPCQDRGKDSPAFHLVGEELWCDDCYGGPAKRRPIATQHRSTSAPPVPSPREFLTGMMRLANLGLGKALESAFSAEGFQRADVELLIEISQGYGSQREIAKVLGISEPSIGLDANRLEARGWIERRPGRDRRVNHLDLTDAGLEVLRRAHVVFKAVNAELDALLSPEQREMVMEFLRKVYAWRKEQKE